MKDELKTHLKDFTATEDGGSAILSLPASFSGFQGHFPDNPVLPGVCLVQAGVLLAGQVLGKDVRMRALKRAKFLSPIVVDDAVQLSCTLSGMKAKISVARGDKSVAQFQLELQEAGS